MSSTALRRGVISVVVLGAVVLLGYGFSRTRPDKPRPVPVQGGAVERLIPESGDLDLRQARIGVDLAATYEGALQVDGTEIPDDELQRVPGLNQIFFTPGPGTATGALAPGRHSATVIYWPVGQTRDAAGQRLTWSFNVH